MIKEKNIYYYQSYSDDAVKSNNQNYKLKNNYKWIKNNIFYKILSCILYYTAYVIGGLYCRIFLHIKIKNRKIIKACGNQGFFLYGNHTQTIGDVFIPTCICKPKRIYSVSSTANLGVIGIGPLLPILGALPIPDNLADMKKLYTAVQTRIKQKKCVVIYPEAHVWPYYTKIRPFDETAFNFPVTFNAPSYCITTTYYKRKHFNKPGIIIYVDGPFMPKEGLNRKEKQKELCNRIKNVMENRSMNSTYEYIEYKMKK